MNTSNQIICVMRSINGHSQWVAAEGRLDLKNNEPSMIGFFRAFDERTGPSGSHVITCYEPIRADKCKLDISDFASKRGALSTRTPMSCVVRLIRGHAEYVEAKGRNDLIDGERLLTGYGFSSEVASGPSGSHKVTVWNFKGAVETGVVQLNRSPESSIAPSVIAAAASLLLSGQPNGLQAGA